jgi:hypothetical protein
MDVLNEQSFLMPGPTHCPARGRVTFVLCTYYSITEEKEIGLWFFGNEPDEQVLTHATKYRPKFLTDTSNDRTIFIDSSLFLWPISPGR